MNSFTISIICLMLPILGVSAESIDSATKPILSQAEAAKIAEGFLAKADPRRKPSVGSVVFRRTYKYPANLSRDFYYEVDYGSPGNGDFSMNSGFTSGIKKWLRVNPDGTASFEETPWIRAVNPAQNIQKSAEELQKETESIEARKGEPYQDLLLKEFFENPSERKQILLELVRLQLSLTQNQAASFLEAWPTGNLGGEFLPLVRKMVKEPFYDPSALKALSELKPDEARPLIVEDVKKQVPRYLTYKSNFAYREKAYLSLPEAPIPELEPVLREAFQTSKGDMFLMALLLNRYGSPALLPDVKKWYVPKEGLWACDIQTSVLQFWIREEPEEGIQALERVLKLRGNSYSHCYASVLKEVLLNHWNGAALPLLERSLKDPDGEVVVCAVQVLAAKADAKWLEPCIAALEKAPRKEMAKGHLDSISSTADRLIQNERWKPSEDQVRRLKKVYQPGQ